MHIKCASARRHGPGQRPARPPPPPVTLLCSLWTARRQPARCSRKKCIRTALGCQAQHITRNLSARPRAVHGAHVRWCLRVSSRRCSSRPLRAVAGGRAEQGAPCCSVKSKNWRTVLRRSRLGGASASPSCHGRSSTRGKSFSAPSPGRRTAANGCHAAACRSARAAGLAARAPSSRRTGRARRGITQYAYIASKLGKCA